MPVVTCEFVWVYVRVCKLSPVAICMMAVWNSAFLSSALVRTVHLYHTVQNWVALDLSVPKTHSLVVQYTAT